IDSPDRVLLALRRLQRHEIAFAVLRFVLVRSLTVIDENAAAISELAEPDIELGVVTVAGERDIGQMPIKRAGREHLDAVDGRALRLVDRGRIAMIEIGIEPLFDRDLPALTTL